MRKHITEMNITKIDKYKKTEHQFYDGAQNRHEPALLRRNTKQNTTKLC